MQSEGRAVVETESRELLAVRLHHLVAFQSTGLWKSAADLKTQTGARLGFTLTRETEGSSKLEGYLEQAVDGSSRVLVFTG